MRETEIRLLSDGDVALLGEVADDVFDNPVRAELAAQYLADPRNLIAVALDGGVVVGMATALTYIHPDKPLQLFVNEIGVASSHQRRGVGKRLLQAVLQAARERGCAEAWVATEEENRAARALYHSLQGKEDADRAVVYRFAL